MEKSLKRAIVCLVVLLVFVVGASPAGATRLVYDWEPIHMGEDRGQPATNLELTIWQKEPWIEVLGWDYKLQKTAAEGGDVLAEGENVNGVAHDDDAYREDHGIPTNDKKHAVDLSIPGLNVPLCTNLWLKTSLLLTSKNNLHKRDLEWTFDGAPPGDGGLPPDEGFAFGDFEPDPGNPGRYRLYYSIFNDDPARWFRVENLAFLLCSGLSPIDEPETMLAWPGWVPYAGVAFVLEPGSEMTILLDDLGRCPWLYAKLDKHEVDPAGNPIGDPRPTVQIHQTYIPEPGCLALLGLALVGVGAKCLGRRRREHS